MSGVRRDSSGRRACDVGGCWQPWPCGLHGTLQVGTPRATGQLFGVDGGPRVTPEESCRGCGYHQCSKQGPCAPKPPPASSVYDFICDKAEELYRKGDRLVAVHLTRSSFLDLTEELAERARRLNSGYPRRDSAPWVVTINLCCGPVEVRKSDGVRFVTERQRALAAALSRALEHLHTSGDRSVLVPERTRDGRTVFHEVTRETTELTPWDGGSAFVDPSMGRQRALSQAARIAMVEQFLAPPDGSPALITPAVARRLLEGK